MRDVRVLDVASGTLGDPVDVRVRGGVIETISPAGSLRAISAPVIQGEGATLLPGLLDMHGHVVTGTAPSVGRRRELTLDRLHGESRCALGDDLAVRGTEETLRKGYPAAGPFNPTLRNHWPRISCAEE